MVRIRTGAVGLFIYSATNGWDAGDYVNSLYAVGDEQRSRAAVGVDALGYVHVVWTQPIENDEYYSEIFYDERDPSGVWATTPTPMAVSALSNNWYNSLNTIVSRSASV